MSLGAIPGHLIELVYLPIVPFKPWYIRPTLGTVVPRSEN
jgi:hypothetical protein